MPGTKIGGQKAAITNKKKHGEDFYRNIGRKGGRNGHTGGFASNPELAKAAGRKGGKISRRRPKSIGVNNLSDIAVLMEELKRISKEVYLKEKRNKQEEMEDQKFIKKISW